MDHDRSCSDGAFQLGAEQSKVHFEKDISDWLICRPPETCRKTAPLYRSITLDMMVFDTTAREAWISGRDRDGHC
jgi:hypothetical protein